MIWVLYASKSFFNYIQYLRDGARILVYVTIYRRLWIGRLWIGRDGNLYESEASDIP